MAGPKFGPPEFRPKIGADCSYFDLSPFPHRRSWRGCKSSGSRADPPDQLGTPPKSSSLDAPKPWIADLDFSQRVAPLAAIHQGERRASWQARSLGNCSLGLTRHACITGFHPNAQVSDSSIPPRSRAHNRARALLCARERAPRVAAQALVLRGRPSPAGVATKAAMAAPPQS